MQCPPLAAAAVLVLLAPAAFSATLRVPRDHPTIQAAIDAAVAGDVVSVSRGSYPEALLIDGRADITLRGRGKPTVTGAGAALLHVRGGSSEIVVEGLVFDGAAQTGVLVEGSSDVTIRRCEVRNAGSGIRLEASDRVLVEKNQLAQIGGDAIGMDDRGATIPRNLDCRILKNRIGDTAGDGIALHGASHWVAKNRIEGIAGLGIVSDPNSAGIFFEKNRLQDTVGNAMDIDGSEHTVQKNRIRGGGGDGIALRAADCLVDKNRVDDAGDDGIDVEGPDNDVLANKVRRSSGDGIEVGDGGGEEATGNLFEKNAVTRSGDNGFAVGDGGNLLRRNRASKSAGFDLLDASGAGSNVYDANKFGTRSGP